MFVPADSAPHLVGYLRLHKRFVETSVNKDTLRDSSIGHEKEETLREDTRDGAAHFPRLVTGSRDPGLWWGSWTDHGYWDVRFVGRCDCARDRGCSVDELFARIL